MKEDVCDLCKGNDYIYFEDSVESCPLCTALGKLYEPQEVENETRTETLYSHNS
jgi:hypothetical protein